MTAFTLLIQGAMDSKQIDHVEVFVGEDSSGSFGVLAGHARLLTTLVVGLARFRCRQQEWQYLAVPGAVLYFRENKLVLSTRHFLLDSDYTRISNELRIKLLAEETQLQAMKNSLHTMEERALKRIWELRRGGAVSHD